MNHCKLMGHDNRMNSSAATWRWVFVVVVATALGCRGNGPDLVVRGEVSVGLPDVDAGFNFERDTGLIDDRVAISGGTVAGHCTFEGERLSLGVSRVRGGGSDLESFSVERTFEDGAQNSVSSGEVTAQVAGTRLASDECPVELLYADRMDRQAGVRLACALESTDGSTGQAEAELHFAGCVPLF